MEQISNFLKGIKGFLSEFNLKRGAIMSMYLTIFTVPPFGMSAITSLFTKVVRPLIKFWRLHAIGIAYFLVDDLTVEWGISESEMSSNFVQTFS